MGRAPLRPAIRSASGRGSVVCRAERIRAAPDVCAAGRGERRPPRDDCRGTSGHARRGCHRPASVAVFRDRTPTRSAFPTWIADVSMQLRYEGEPTADGATTFAIEDPGGQSPADGDGRFGRSRRHPYPLAGCNTVGGADRARRHRAALHGPLVDLAKSRTLGAVPTSCRWR